VNDAPRLSCIPEIRPYEDTELVVNLSGFIEDPDTQRANISIRIDSRFGQVDGQRLIFNYSEGILCDEFNLTLSDGTENTTYLFQVQIVAVDDPPVLATIPTISVVAGESRTVPISVVDPDTPISEIRMWSTSPYVSVDGFNITLSYPDDTPNQTRQITLRLSDGSSVNLYSIPVNITASKIKERPVPSNNIYLYILLPLAIIGTAAGLVVYRRVRYGWYRMKRAMLVNDDGRLLAHIGEKDEAQDEMLVGGMLTAVQQYIEDVMKKEKAGAIKEFMYEDLRIAIERGEKIFLAVFIEGYATESLRKKMKEIVTGIETKYKSELASWDGMMTKEAFIAEAEERVKMLKEGK